MVQYAMDQLPLTLPQLVIIAGFMFVLAELFIGIEAGFDLVLIGSILIISGFTGIFTTSILVTLVVASILAIVYIAYGRQRIRQRITVITHKTNIDKLIGQKGIVIRSITPDTPGLVRVKDEDWRATSEDVLYEKDHITVNSIEGVTIHVTKFNKLKKG